MKKLFVFKKDSSGAYYFSEYKGGMLPSHSFVVYMSLEEAMEQESLLNNS